jgi:endogenous inhibitor of DNA gyrase (YacG/DUF329 family)
MAESNNTSTSQKVVKPHKCPICSKITDNYEYRPFCSKRCSDVDLGNWFTESYVIEGSNAQSEESED